MLRNKKGVLGIFLLIITVVSLTVSANYVPSNRDTSLPPKSFDLENAISDTTAFELLYATEGYMPSDLSNSETVTPDTVNPDLSEGIAYYFKDERDVIAIHDTRNNQNYLWKTGLDVPFRKDAKDICDDAPEDQKEELCEPYEDRLNTTYTGLANSLLSIEYYDVTDSINRLSSAGYENVTSDLKRVSGTDNHYILNVDFYEENYKYEVLFDLSVDVHIYFNEDGMSYEVKHEELSGESLNSLAAIIFNPFFGASGGQKVYYGDPNPNDDDDEKDYDIVIPNEMMPGYVLVPDGSGALIRFKDYETSLKNYTGDVYGKDYGHSTRAEFYEPNYVPFNNPVMPVYGVAHGNRQNAFVGYAESASEFMQIIVSPEENMTHYTWAYPRFELNKRYYQPYSRTSGNMERLEEHNKFDIKMTYDFLAGDGSHDELPADYVGMAKQYKKYLIETNTLSIEEQAYNEIPIRLDFIMSDVKKNILGYKDVVLTDIDDVESILSEVMNTGITNINSGLYGWQQGGITLSRPWETDWNNEVGRKRDFQDVIDSMRETGVDLSLAQDYTHINEEQMSIRQNAARHINNYYITKYLNIIDAPVTEINYARPDKSIDWLGIHLDEIEDLNTNSTTIEGISNNLYSDYDDKERSVTDSIELYRKGFKEANKSHMINAKDPNLYTWDYVDRYLDAPVYPTQYLYETDTVPFLQLVLNGTMEVYAPYSNFSFYTVKDQLRMIDYNVYPSFMLTEKPSYNLNSTNSSEFYSTEFTQYQKLIDEVYNEVNGSLKDVINSEWIDREVYQNGVIINTYSNGKQVVINYTDTTVTYNNQTINPLSARVL
ncbi:DUF5696 domain-containing protein [Haloplasma contractile]|uniref:ABC transporter substrate-binding protein n=1 Tax=Haloplasma contractile SSD-17B TaxID=1033810 RepID=U2FFB1_9MOLU|nr:DUF5696 domain-containing protein [Haloplasma contractile]ERJ11600.1 ABC transporter substrate-binding protein [Haloplasma contractile SSD-17B]